MDGDEVEVEQAVTLPEPMYTEDALRCTMCSWEIVDGFCHNCGLEHSDYPVCYLVNNRQHRY